MFELGAVSSLFRRIGRDLIDQSAVRCFLGELKGI